MSGSPARRRTARASSARIYKRNPYSQLLGSIVRRRTRTQKRRKATNPSKEYLERVRVLMHKVNEADDKEENHKSILKELNKIGEVYFGEHYVGASEEPDDDPVQALTKKQFQAQYEEEIGEENDGDDASFSDAFRHAALIDVDTLKVPPLELWSGVAAELAKTDYVFTWEMINKLPAKVAGTQFVAIHFDTDGSILFVPIPG